MERHAPTFLVRIEGEQLSEDIAQSITAFSFEDNEEQLDVCEITVLNAGLRYTDHPLLQENNLLTVQFGYVGNLSPAKTCIIREIDYDFPSDGVPTIRMKAYDQAIQLSAVERQRVWEKEAPGYLYSEIAEEIAKEAGLTPVVEETVGRHMRIAQSNQSDAKFLLELARQAANQQGVAGYSFYVQDSELHFHTRPLDQPPTHTFEFFTDINGSLLSFKPKTQPQWNDSGRGTRSVGIDPRNAVVIEEEGSNSQTANRTSLGRKTYTVDGETGRFLPSYERSESFHEEPVREPAKDIADAKFSDGELRQIEAEAVVIGDPSIKAKANVEVRGVGQKFSGLYYIVGVRHAIDEHGYTCELKGRRNATGSKGATEDTKGKVNDTGDQDAPPPPPPNVVIDAETGETE